MLSTSGLRAGVPVQPDADVECRLPVSGQVLHAVTLFFRSCRGHDPKLKLFKADRNSALQK